MKTQTAATLLVCLCFTACAESAAKAHLDAGLALCRAGKSDEAVVEYRAALTEQPQNTCILNNIGICSINAGKFEQAEAALREALRINPNDHEAEHWLGVIAHHRGDCQTAEAIFRRRIDQFHESRDYRYLGRCLEEIDQKHDAAATAFKQAIAIDPTDERNYRSLANLLYRTDRFAEAIDFYRQAASLESKPIDSLYWSGRALEKLRRNDEAAAAYQKILQLSGPDDAHLPNVRAARTRLEKLTVSPLPTKEKTAATLRSCYSIRSECESARDYIKTHHAKPAEPFEALFSGVDRAKRNGPAAQSDKSGWRVSEDRCAEEIGKLHCFWAVQDKPTKAKR